VTPSLRRYVRPQDFVWLLFFSTLAMFGPERAPVVLISLVALGVVHALEPHIGSIPALVLELALCYPIIYPGGISSSYFVVLVLPVISASTNFGLLGAALSALAACAVYLSMILLLPFRNQYLPAEELPEVVLRALFFLVV